MRRRGACLVATALVAVATGLHGQTPDAAGVLAKAREALGGEKKLAAIKSLTATGETRQVRGDNLVPIVFEINIELPDRYARRDETPAVESGYSTAGFNGDGLIQLPVPASAPPMTMAARPGGPPPPTSEQLAAQLAAQPKTRVTALKQDFTRLTLGMFAASFPAYPLTFTRIGTAESPQGKADVIEAKGPDNFVARLLISQDTHLPVMLSWSAPAGRASGPTPAGAAPTAGTPPAAPRAGAPSAPPAPEFRLFFADYRDVDGVMLPFRIRRATGAETTEETTFDRYKLNPKIDPKKIEVIK